MAQAMKSYKARGVVLSTVKYGDSGMVVQMLTDRYGRQSYMVQGVRSGRGRGSKMALFQPLFLLQFEGLESSHSDLHKMREVQNDVVFKSLPYDIRKSTMALFMAEVLYKLVREVEPNSPLFEFVYNSVVALDNMEEGVHNFHLWFMVGLSRHLGFYPSGEWFEGAVFDIEAGCFTRTMPRSGLFIGEENSRLLGELMEVSVMNLKEIALSRVQRSEFLAALLTYFGYHLDTIHQIQSLRILAEVF